MDAEFRKLYDDYWERVKFLSVLGPDIPEWDALVEWSKEHKSEAVDGIIEILSEGPNGIVRLCDVLFPETVSYDGYIPLDYACSVWLTIMKLSKEGYVTEGLK